MTDLERVDEPGVLTLTNPRTGEVVPLDATTDLLAAYLDDVKILQAELRMAYEVIGDELHRRMDAEGVYTVRAGGLKVTGRSPAPAVEYDAAALRHELLKLAAADRISLEAVNRAVEPVTTYKVRQAGVNALRKQPDLAEAIDRHGSEVVKPRRVNVSRDRG